MRPLIQPTLGAIAVLMLFPGLCANGQEERPVPASPQLAVTRSGEGVALARAKESFSSLSLKDSDLRPERPLLLGKAENTDFTRELYGVQWRPNDPIDLYVIRPRGVKNPPVALYLYGFPTETERFKNDDYCKRLVHGGVAAVGFVSALTGHRAEHRPPSESFISELQESLATTVHDVQMILNYLETRGDLDMSRVGMFGQGSGGAIAVLAASADARIKALDLFEPWGDWPDWLAKANIVGQQRADYLKPDFLGKLELLEPTRYLPGLKDRALRIQFVDTDVDVPSEAAHKIEAAAPSTATVIHYRTVSQMWGASSGGRLFLWITEHLNSQAETKPPATETKERPPKLVE